jgi:hypothetical protein
MDIDVMTLVETVKNRIPELKTNRDAIEYIFSEVATESGEEGRRLNVEHLEYLFDGAIFEHTATGKKTCLACSDATCLTCSAADVCTSCATPANLITQGAYTDAAACTTCGTACYACTSTACTTCYSYTAAEYVADATLRNYYKSSATACTQCAADCWTCAHTSGDCTECHAAHYIKSDGTCV